MINPKKFRLRTKLFSDILCEIFEVESNYRTELKILNLKISEKIEEYKKIANKKIERKNQSFHFRKRARNAKFLNIRPSLSVNNSNNINTDNNNENDETEENPYTDKLVSDGLQKLLLFYQTKHSLISKEVCKLGVIVYNCSTKDKDNSYLTSDEFEILMKNKNKFDENYSKLETARDNYFRKMNELELLFHDNDSTLNLPS